MAYPNEDSGKNVGTRNIGEKRGDRRSPITASRPTPGNVPSVPGFVSRVVLWGAVCSSRGRLASWFQTCISLYWSVGLRRRRAA